ncbi:MAG: hypothetical protein RSD08_01520 [Oscillospiraceae bacterium]
MTTLLPNCVKIGMTGESEVVLAPNNPIGAPPIDELFSNFKQL